MSTATGIAIGTAIAASSNHPVGSYELTQGDAVIWLVVFAISLWVGIRFGIRFWKNGEELFESCVYGFIAFGVAIMALLFALCLIGLLCVALGIA